MKKTLAVTILLIAASPLTFSQPTQSKTNQSTGSGQQAGGTEQDVRRASEEYDKAARDQDAAAYERILADDYTFTDASGRMNGKSKTLEDAKSGDWKFQSGTSDIDRVRIYGNTAIVNGVWKSKGQYKGKDFNTTERFTTVYVKRGGRWQVVADQLTPLGAQAQGQ